METAREILTDDATRMKTLNNFLLMWLMVLRKQVLTKDCCIIHVNYYFWIAITAFL